jgi:hypothetical protein
MDGLNLSNSAIIRDVLGGSYSCLTCFAKSEYGSAMLTLGNEINQAISELPEKSD